MTGARGQGTSAKAFRCEGTESSRRGGSQCAQASAGAAQCAMGADGGVAQMSLYAFRCRATEPPQQRQQMAYPQRRAKSARMAALRDSACRRSFRVSSLTAVVQPLGGSQCRKRARTLRLHVHVVCFLQESKQHGDDDCAASVGASAAVGRRHEQSRAARAHALAASTVSRNVMNSACAGICVAERWVRCSHSDVRKAGGSQRTGAHRRGEQILGHGA